MFRIKDLKAGEFIDIDNYYREFETGDNNSELLFFDILKIEKPTNQQEYLDFFKEYEIQMTEIKENYEFVYNPPPLPSTLSTEQNTIGTEYRKEFSQMYGGYVENVYLLSTIFHKLPNEILEMNALDFLFWANYLNHKKWCEQIK
jgi:hypothetical protein